MRSSTRGSATEGHVAEQMSRQSFPSVEKACNWEDAQEAEAKVWPSRRVRMWVMIMSGWTEDIEAPSP